MRGSGRGCKKVGFVKVGFTVLGVFYPCYFVWCSHFIYFLSRMLYNDDRFAGSVNWQFKSMA